LGSIRSLLLAASFRPLAALLTVKKFTGSAPLLGNELRSLELQPPLGPPGRRSGGRTLGRPLAAASSAEYTTTRAATAELAVRRGSGLEGCRSSPSRICNRHAACAHHRARTWSRYCGNWSVFGGRLARRRRATAPTSPDPKPGTRRWPRSMRPGAAAVPACELLATASCAVVGPQHARKPTQLRVFCDIGDSATGAPPPPPGGWCADRGHVVVFRRASKRCSPSGRRSGQAHGGCQCVTRVLLIAADGDENRGRKPQDSQRDAAAERSLFSHRCGHLLLFREDARAYAGVSWPVMCSAGWVLSSPRTTSPWAARTVAGFAAVRTSAAVGAPGHRRLESCRALTPANGPHRHDNSHYARPPTTATRRSPRRTGRSLPPRRRFRRRCAPHCGTTPGCPLSVGRRRRRR